MGKRLKHVGAESFIAERGDLLAKYDKAKQQTTDDAVKTSHGNVGEAVLRAWLTRFLPKKFGVTKGFIITHDLDYEGPLEEWDIIIYDRLESPVLFVRDSPDETASGSRLAIPIEHVRGVVEAKATFRPDMARKVREKLGKLRHFVGTNESADYPKFLVPPFACTAVFFESAVKNYAEFRMALADLLDDLTYTLMVSDLADALGAVVERLFDLLSVIRNGYYYPALGAACLCRCGEYRPYSPQNMRRMCSFCGE